ncbi:hypothetical protein Moror_14629 [Moniliophthora roreri MCA 2997]|uniref:Tc1-like transposase DDE domain-containing protein n=1 Tax=Moniliophthora roreri (strain MCA 2997) TaxID=1381753 RepID=V2XK60_MONRO|nr:hypothetical protein Moror_14629 [Moniliophthora roreri MCA 2997]
MFCAQHSSLKKNWLIGALQTRSTICEASKLAGIPYDTSWKIWRKFCETSSTSNRQCSSCPRKVTERAKQQLIRTAKKNRQMPFEQIGNQTEPHLSASTVPWLTKAQKNKKLSWACQQKRTDWSLKVWSDEAYVCQDGAGGRVYVTHRADEELKEDCVVPTFKQSSIRVMVWACIMKDRKGPLIVLEYPGGRGGGMTAKRYQEQVLEGCLLHFYEEMKSERGEISFQQDSAPSHTAKSTTQWLRSHNINLFPHPPSSPDVNPIEPLWHKLKHRLCERQHHLKTMEGLIAVVKEVWEEIPVDVVNKYVARMDKIVDAIIKARGGHTRF